MMQSPMNIKHYAMFASVAHWFLGSIWHATLQWLRMETVSFSS